MARSMACELGPQRIRVNTISPAFINTRYVLSTESSNRLVRSELMTAVLSMTGQLLAARPDIEEKWAEKHPLARIGRPEELRGVAVWLASDASSFCTGGE